MERKVWGILAFLFLAFTFTAPVAHALTSTTDGLTTTISLSPRYPGSNTEVTVTLYSTETNLDSAIIAWSLNGKKLDSGVGIKSVKWTTGEVGEEMVLLADIEDINKETGSHKMVLNPGDVDLLWETTGSVPATYPGKALVAPYGKVTAVAMPIFKGSDGKVIPPGDLMYFWKEDNKDNLEASGFNKTSYTAVFGNEYSEKKIGVVVSEMTGGVIAEKTITLKPTIPQVLFYEDRALLGPNYAHAILQTFNIYGKEAMFRGEPYYFDKTTLATAKVGWKVDGNAGNILPENPWLLTVRPTVKNGESTMSITVSPSKGETTYNGIYLKY